MLNGLKRMFQTITRHRAAHEALRHQSLKIKALRLREVEPREVPIEFRSSGFWDRVSNNLGHGIMFARTSYQTEDEAAISCHWEEGAMMHPHCHPESEEYVYVIRGALKDHVKGAILYPGERVSIEDVLAGTAQAQPYVIPAGQAHFLQALEPDTFFVIKFKRQDGNTDNCQ